MNRILRAELNAILLSILSDRLWEMKKFASSEKFMGKIWFREVTEGVIEGGYKGIEAAEPVCFSESEIHFAVKTLHNPEGKLLFGVEVIEDERLMAADGTDEPLDGFKLGSHGPGAPFIEGPFGPCGGFVGPQMLEGFLEQVGTHTFEIVLEDIVEFANKAATLSVTRMDAQSSSPNLDELENV